jgi:DNA-binding beta-propeller fold protein YncE
MKRRFDAGTPCLVLVVLGLLLIFMPTMAAAAPGDVLLVIGSGSPVAGTAPGQLNYPLDVALDGAGSPYVMDYANGRVQVFDPDGNFLFMWGEHTYCSQGGCLAQPQGIGIDGQGMVYVSDPGNRNIQIFTAEGQFVDFLATFGFGPDQVYWPQHYAFDAADNLYVTDFTLDRIQVFDRHGKVSLAFGEEGDGDGQFYGLVGIALDAGGNIYAGDNDEIQVFDPEGSYLRSWGSYGEGPGQFKYTDGIAIDPAGRVFVADNWNHRIQVFNATGDLLDIWGEYGQEPGQFYVPTGLALDPVRNRLYVVDMWNHRVQVLKAFGPYGGEVDFAGFLPPVSLAKPVKTGSTLPVKFRLAGDQPMDGQAVLSVQCGSTAYDPEPIVGSGTGGVFRFNGKRGYYHYNLSTGHLPAGTCTLTVNLSDGSEHSAPLYLK